MSDEAAILAQFSDWRTVKGRKVLQLIFEVPLEDQAKVLTHLGAPMPMADLWCGIARVARKGKAGDAPNREGGAVKDLAVRTSPATNSVTLVEGETGGAPRVLTAAPPVSKSKRRWSEMPPSQRAALWIKDPEVWRFFNRTMPPGVDLVRSDADADAELKRHLCIGSKSELDAPANDAARARFSTLVSQFQADRQARGHGVI